MQNEEGKKETKVLRQDQIEVEGRVITFGDAEQIIDKDGVAKNVNMFIPQCCREGWDSCPHVPKKQKKFKNNIGL